MNIISMILSGDVETIQAVKEVGTYVAILILSFSLAIGYLKMDSKIDSSMKGSQ